MMREVSEVLEAAKALTPDERADLAYQILMTLDGNSPADNQTQVESEWRKEIRRRVDDHLDGNSNLISVEDSHARIRATLAASRV